MFNDLIIDIYTIFVDIYWILFWCSIRLLYYKYWQSLPLIPQKETKIFTALCLFDLLFFIRYRLVSEETDVERPLISLRSTLIFSLFIIDGYCETRKNRQIWRGPFLKLLPTVEI